MMEPTSKEIKKIIERLEGENYVDAIDEAIKILKRLDHANLWYRTRWAYLQKWQASIPDPYCQEACDILANGTSYRYEERIDGTDKS